MSHWNARTSRRRSLFRHDVRQRAFQYADESGAENHRTERKEKGLLNAAKSDCSYPIEMFVASAFYRVPRLKAIATRSRPFSHGRTCTRKTHTHTKTCWFHFEYSQHLLLSTVCFLWTQRAMGSVKVRWSGQHKRTRRIDVRCDDESKKWMIN